jgi:hypothetical protein
MLASTKFQPELFLLSLYYDDHDELENQIFPIISYPSDNASWALNQCLLCNNPRRLPSGACPPLFRFGYTIANTYPHWYQNILMTDLVFGALSAQGFTGLSAIPARLDRRDMPKLPKKMPDYVYTTYTGRVTADLGDFANWICDGPDCHWVHRPKEIEPMNPIFLPLIETWDGSDFCSTTNVRRLTFCSRRVVEYAVKHQIPAVMFEYPDPSLNLPKIQSMKPGALETFDEAFAKLSR